MWLIFPIKCIRQETFFFSYQIYKNLILSQPTHNDIMVLIEIKEYTHFFAFNFSVNMSKKIHVYKRTLGNDNARIGK